MSGASRHMMGSDKNALLVNQYRAWSGTSNLICYMKWHSKYLMSDKLTIICEWLIHYAFHSIRFFSVRWQYNSPLWNIHYFIYVTTENHVSVSIYRGHFLTLTEIVRQTLRWTRLTVWLLVTQIYYLIFCMTNWAKELQGCEMPFLQSILSILNSKVDPLVYL